MPADYYGPHDPFAPHATGDSPADHDRQTARALLEANGWTLEQTGGGCTAYTKRDRSWYWMITRQDGPTAPELSTDPVTVGSYRIDSSDPFHRIDYTTLQQWADSHYLRQDPAACPDCGVSLAAPTACPLHAGAPEMLHQLQRLVYFHRTNDTPNTDPWADAQRIIAKVANAGPASSPEPSNPHPDHSCAENALRGNRCGICGAFLVAE